jgi:hypothetical protein
MLYNLNEEATFKFLLSYPWFIVGVYGLFFGRANEAVALMKLSFAI